jgi:glutamate dehydrogenase
VGEDRREALLQGVRDTLADVRSAVQDHQRMLALVERTTSELEQAAPRRDPEALAEAVAFLRWVAADNFVFLGARAFEYPRTPEGGYAAAAPLTTPEESLGVLRDPERLVLRRANEPAILTAQLQRQIDLDEPLVVGKANLPSRVHRRVRMDYIGIRRYGPDGRPSGEIRVVGLFAAEAYDRAAVEVPLIRRKLQQVFARAATMPGSHNAKRLRNIVENYPARRALPDQRSELLETSHRASCTCTTGRACGCSCGATPSTASCRCCCSCRATGTTPASREGRSDPVARLGRAGLRLLSRATPTRASFGCTSSSACCRASTASRTCWPWRRRSRGRATWGDRFDQVVRERHGGAGAGELISRYADGFAVGYQDLYDAEEALADVSTIESMRPEDTVRCAPPASRMTR